MPLVLGRCLDLLTAAITGGSAGQDVGGEEPYDPASDEFVLLLSIKVDNAPVIGADVVRAVQAPDGSMRLINPQLDGLLGGAA